MGDPSAALIALGALGVLALVMRWIFTPARRRGVISRPVDAAQSEALGLLSVVATGLARQEALTRRAQLGEVGIRSSMSNRRDGAFDVLVFHGDVDRARDVLEP